MAHLYPLNTSQKFTFFYNVCSFTLWFCCFIRFLILLPLVGRMFLPAGIADFFHMVSVLPVLGFLVVKAFVDQTLSLSSTWALLNGMRMVWLSYGVIFPHPKIAKHTSYSFLIFAWCVSNIIHSAYYGFKVKTRSMPFTLLWLEYHHYYITFPVAFVAELIQVFLSLGFVGEDAWHELSLKATFLAYFPLALYFWRHLHTKRSKRYDDIKAKIDESRARISSSDDAAHSTATTRHASTSPIPEGTELRNIPAASD